MVAGTVDKPLTFAGIPKILNGAMAGLVGVTCVFPIDLVKTRLQNQQVGPNGELMYKNMRDCFIKTWRNQPYLGMYRGAGVNLLLITPEKAIKLVCNDFFRHRMGEGTGQLTFFGALVSGAGAGLCQIVVTTPMELLKIQQQDAGRINTGAGNAAAVNAKRITATQMAKKLVAEKGLPGLYRGFGSTALRDVPFSAIYFPLFGYLQKLGPARKDGKPGTVFWFNCLSGIVAGSVGSFAVNPIDVVKTRLQTIEKGKTEASYSGIRDCFVKTYQMEGMPAFFKGASCRILVIAPLFGIAQTFYELGVAERILGYDR
ncbi:mitochondrial glutamate carrier 1 [Lingula anatina]|uniref:Mitochondrial glutamate carrier 2 n=1 Tax=Lingula anatina TaxID=7574 RepID=A0A1S3K2S6_LINAN|nr:mitochondrial glutamate carrier 1 [Lingula anatina]XP_013416703.1 mitochondrial glutamate carrier 1 [Lingula anatina]XP_013416704.1 mitochondrial glutamate carrier 1 [Lingula anatina]XP_013416705.1 mitochondrial glutamate carrier 1 [Lingula anatina]|eukprot:XP_013416702.1 mitochondrial glutamate carrier 1 [Lingula anatina]